MYYLNLNRHRIKYEHESNHCVGDIDGSGQVDIVDILLLLALWGDANTPAADAADVNQDGHRIDVHDLLMVLRQWGGCDSP